MTDNPTPVPLVVDATNYNVITGTDGRIFVDVDYLADSLEDYCAMVFPPVTEDSTNLHKHATMGRETVLALIRDSADNFRFRSMMGEV